LNWRPLPRSFARSFSKNFFLQFEDPRVAAQQKRKEEALHHEARLPQYKRNLRRKLLKLRHLFRHQQKQVRSFAGWEVAFPVSPSHPLTLTPLSAISGRTVTWRAVG
jgi:hypothetical protein